MASDDAGDADADVDDVDSVDSTDSVDAVDAVDGFPVFEEGDDAFVAVQRTPHDIALSVRHEALLQVLPGREPERVNLHGARDQCWPGSEIMIDDLEQKFRL